MASAAPERFRAFVAEREGDTVRRAVRELGRDELPEGDVVVRVLWSSVNFKDALAASADGRVARISPLVPGIDLAGEVVEAGPDGTRFRVSVRGKARGEARIRVPGVHYAQNAVAALAVADFFGVPFDAYVDALAGFSGVDRRFSVRGEARGILVVDDYGHHPTEIAATIAAARLFDRRVVVAFQPHRYSRTQDLMQEFAPALGGADLLFLTDVYAAGEAPIAGVTSERLLATFPLRPGLHYAPRAALPERLLEALRPGDLLLTLGAGDVTQVATEVLAALR